MEGMEGMEERRECTLWEVPRLCAQEVDPVLAIEAVANYTALRDPYIAASTCNLRALIVVQFRPIRFKHTPAHILFRPGIDAALS